MEQWLHDHSNWIAIALAASELMGMLPWVKSSSLIEIVIAALKAARDAVAEAPKE